MTKNMCKVIVLGIFLCFFMLNCGSDDSGLEITGTWFVDNINPSTGAAGIGSMTIVISSTNYTSTFDEDGDGADDGAAEVEVIEYSNGEDNALCRIIAHTESDTLVGKYLEFIWVLSGNTMTVTSFSYEDDPDAARNSTNIAWGPITFTKQ